MRKAIALVGTLIATSIAVPAVAATATRSTFGTLKDGTPVGAVMLSASNGVSARIIAFGATLQAFNVPDHKGHIADIVIGFDSAEEYETNHTYWGATVGRFANRIAGGKFILGGKSYRLPLNDKTNSLHGGDGFDRKMWRIVSVKSGQKASVTMDLISPDGDQGYPGTLHVTATYTLDDSGELTIDYDATTDAATVVNITNHALFSLAGEGAPAGALGLRLTIPATRFTPVDATLIPTGVFKPVSGTVFDFTKGRMIADGVRNGRDLQIAVGRGYDHNFALDKGTTDTPELAARLEDPISGRMLEVLTTAPGVQLYTGNFIDGTLRGKSGHIYRMGDGIALEPQLFPDTPNQPHFGSALVSPGKPYHHRIIFRVGPGEQLPRSPAR